MTRPSWSSPPADAQLNLAKMYLAGRGVALNVAEARAWLATAAANGRSEAAALLAEIAQGRRESSRGAPHWSTTVAAATPGSLAWAPRLDGGTRNGLPAVLDAAWRGQAQALRQLIAAGQELRVADDDGN